MTISDKKEASELQRGQLTMQVCAVSNLLDTQARCLMMVINDIRDLKPGEWEDSRLREHKPPPYDDGSMSGGTISWTVRRSNGE